MIKKIWHDPVWSKVISIGIIGLITLGYTKFLSVTEEITFKVAFDKILEIKIAVVYVIAILIVYWILAWLFKKIFKKEKTKQQKLREFNKTTDPKTSILFKWDVFFDYDTPFISNLTSFCTKHGETPIRFIGDSCPIQGCENSRQRIDKYAVKNFIESELIDKWEKIK